MTTAAIGPAQCYRDAQPKNSCTVMPERLGAMAIAAAGAYAVTSGFVVSQPAAQQPSEVRLRGAQAQPNSSAGFSSTVLNLAGAGTVVAGLAVSQRKRTALARLLTSATSLWLLDEPTVSLDTDGVVALEAAIAAHRAGGGMVMLATHIDLDLPDAAVLQLGRRVAA